MKNMRKNVLIAGLIIISLLFFVRIVGADNNQNIIYVDDDGNADFTVIQDAINVSKNDSFVYIMNGTYNEDIYVNKTLNLIGEDKKNTEIKGCIHILADKVNISDLLIDSSRDLQNNTDNGIEILSNSNEITNNTICNNEIGIYIFNFDNNSIYHNDFYNNTLQSKDEGNNSWFNKKLLQGNFWDDYNGTDKDADGIGDEPYNITGSGILDKYPLMMPYDDFIENNKITFNLDEIAYVLTIGVIFSVIFLVPIAYYFRKKILKL